MRLKQKGGLRSKTETEGKKINRKTHKWQQKHRLSQKTGQKQNKRGHTNSNRGMGVTG